MRLQKAFGKNSKEAKDLAEKLAYQESRQSSLKKTIEKTNNDLLKAQTRQEAIKNAINETNKQIVLQTDKTIKNGQAWQESGEKLKKYGEKIDKIGNKLSVISAGVGGIAVASLKSAIDFETAFTGVIKTVDGTEEQLASLKKGILDMSTKLPSSASEIASVAEAAGQLGIQVDNILDFTKVMIDLGNSTNVSADEASTALAKFANVTKMSADEYQRLGSTIVALGNNYATTEADIISMAQNLASAGTQVGMSQSDIMALATALSSVGLEAQAGGTAFSKALVEMQLAVETNSKDLKNWADVAGMSIKEFTKLFKEDATSALQAFIKGLSECGGETESAIKVLDDMGITETRMRDALLRSANASDTFTSAIELGNKAWEENTALTEEAEKRYGTTESQLSMLKNEVQKTAIEFGEELAPSLKQIVKSISSAVKVFSELNDEQKQTILKIGAVVVASGPALKIAGTTIKTLGSVKKSLGTVKEAVGLLKKGIGDATGAGADLAKTLKNIASPAGLVTTAIGTGLAVAIGTAVSNYNKATEETRKYSEEIQKARDKILEEKQAIDEINTTIDTNVQTHLDEIERTRSLWEELQKITDENGKIKEGYENRAKVITGTLSEALGQEITITGNVIDKYKDLQKEMDNLIAKKRGETILEGLKEKNDNAVSDISQKTQELLDAQDKLKDAQKKLDEAQKQFDDEAYKNGYVSKATSKNLEESKIAIQNAQNNVNDLQKIVNSYLDSIEDYNYNLELFTDGSVESLNKMAIEIGKTYKKDDETVRTSIERRIAEQQLYIKSTKDLYEEARKNHNEVEMYKSQTTITEASRRLELLSEELRGMTSLTKENSEEVVNGWKKLATDSYNIYFDIVSNYPEDLQEVIQNMTGVVIEERPELVQETQNMSQDLLDAIDKSPEFKSIALANLKSYLQGLEDNELRILLETSGIENADKVIEGIRKGNLGETEGMQILNSLNEGLQNQTWKDKLFKTARGIASSLSDLLKVNTTITTNTNTSTNGSHADGLAYVPYNNYVARLHEGERVLTKEQNREFMADNLENKITSRNIVVQFYPQTMSEAELQRAERYIARKWGAAL